MTREDLIERVRAESKQLGVRYCRWADSARIGYNGAPLIMRLFGWNTESAFMTIEPYVYHPDSIKDPCLEVPEVCAHEIHHIRQQKSYGAIRWLLEYVLSDQFRWEQEREAYLIDIETGRLSIADAAKQLSRNYFIDKTVASRRQMLDWFTNAVKNRERYGPVSQ